MQQPCLVSLKKTEEKDFFIFAKLCLFLLFPPSVGIERGSQPSRSRCLGPRLVAELDETIVSFTGGVRERHSCGGGGG